MALIIDGREYENLSGPLALSLSDVLDQIARDGRYVESILVNQKEVTVSAVSSPTFQCEDSDTVQVVTCTLDELVNHTMESSFQVVPTWYKTIQECVEAFRTGHDEVGMDKLSSAVTVLQWHMDVLGNLTQLNPGPSMVHDLHDELGQVVPNLFEALERRDFTLLADLIEYELVPWLEKWYGMLNLFNSQMQLETLKQKNLQ